MENSNSYPDTIKHPETGELMVLDTTQGVQASEARLTKNIGNAEAGRHVLEQIRAKETEHGRIYRNPITGYQHRHKPGAAPTSGKGPAADTSGQASGEAPAPAAESNDARRARLRAELDALDAQ